MQRLDLTLPDLTDNLATDEALLMEREELPELGEILRFWEVPAYAVVLGSGGIVADDVNIESCNRDGVPIARRSSGGGTVLLGRGCLLYSLVLDMESNSALAGISTSYEFIIQRHLAIVESIRRRDIEECHGRVDLPNVLACKYPNANREWRYLFPQENRWRNPKTGEQGRHHMDEALVQRALATAVRETGLTIRVT